MWEAIKSYWTLRWTQQPQLHPLPQHITRNFIKTPAGDIELLTSSPGATSSAKRTPIFFVHGGNGHASVWLEWMTHLSSTYNAHTYSSSLRNHGASFPVPFSHMVWQTNLDELAQDLIAAIQEVRLLEGQDPIIVAHSSGGGLAQYVLSRGLIKARALVLVGSVPHFGNMEVYYNWFTRVDPWFSIRAMYHFMHPNSALNTDTLVRNAFFGHLYPIGKVREFRKWMSNYECLWWPLELGGRGWGLRGRQWLSTTDILKSIVEWRDGRDKIMVMIGTEDRLMGGTEGRMVADFQEGIQTLQRKKKIDTSILLEGEPKEVVQDRYVTENSNGGVRLVRVKGAGHHTQNDLQWEEAAEALRRFAEQA